MGKTCQICGANSGIYPLCVQHLQEKQEGKVIKCEECGKWHLTEKLCNCKKIQKYTSLPTEGFENCVICNRETKGYAFCHRCYKNFSIPDMLDILNGEDKEPTNKTTKQEAQKQDNTEEEQNETATDLNNKIIIIDETNKSRCITCGKKIDGLLFCSSCYHKYKDKELLFKITKCSDVELLDEDYEGKYTCIDGHVVKSKSEREIDEYLFRNGIRHAYEYPLYYGREENEKIHPDFFLPDYLGTGKHVYIEHWGYNDNNIKYTNTKKFKMKIYKDLCQENGITLICTHEKTDMKSIDSNLERKLNKKFIKEGEINFDLE